ncbi:MAG: HIT family protein [Dehalococcoidia bacterium]|nr:HIT family protein [Dehalococcoidia bacterium]
MAKPCVFCGVADGTGAASMVAESPLALAFMDLRQPNPGHVLVVPRAHVRDLLDLDQAAGHEMMDLIRRTARAVHEAFKPDGVNVYQSTGKLAGQEVFHLHFHVLPRKKGDRLFRAYPYAPPPPPSSREELQRQAALIRAELAAIR